MPQNFEVVDKSKQQNPMLGLIGFILIVVLGGFSFGVSGPATAWLQTSTVVLGASGINILPLKFPDTWSPLANQLAVTVGIFLVLFVIAMALMFMFMRPASVTEQSVSMHDMRKEAAARRKAR